MKQFRKIGCFLAAAVLSVSMLASAAAENRPLDEAALRQDFYGTVNADWIAGAQVPPEGGSLSAFTELEKKVDRQLNEDFKAMAAGTMEAPNPEMKKMIAMYKKALDFKTRDAEGTAPLKPYLEKIAAIKTMADLEAISKEWTLTGLADGQDESGSEGAARFVKHEKGKGKAARDAADGAQRRGQRHQSEVPMKQKGPLHPASPPSKG